MQESLTQTVKREDTDKYMEMFAAAFEDGLIEYIGVQDEEEAKVFRGRSRTFVRKKTYKDEMNFDFKHGTSNGVHAHKACYPIKAQAGRAQQWA